MTKSVEDVLKEHRETSSKDIWRSACKCGWSHVATHDKHLAAMLKEAGYGSQHDAWHEGAYYMRNNVMIPDDWSGDNPYPTTEGAS